MAPLDLASEGNRVRSVGGHGRPGTPSRKNDRDMWRGTGHVRGCWCDQERNTMDLPDVPAP